MNSRTTHGPAGVGVRLAVVGPSTLKGKELTEILPESTMAAAEVRLLDDEDTLGQLEAVGEEVTFVQAVAVDNFNDADVVFFTSDPSFTRQTFPLALRAGSAVVDLSYGLEDEKSASVRAPWLDRELAEGMPMDLQPGPVIVAHPASIVLGLLLLRLSKVVKARTTAVTVFEPASERGKKGLDELHQQTVNLLSFQSLPKDVYDAQVAFNLLSRFGAAAASSLESTEKKIAEHLRRIVRGRVPVPSLMLVQAAIFHGHAFSLYLELEKPASMGDLAQALAGEHVEIVRGEEESPSNVGAAGQESIMVTLRADAQNANGIWIWAAADNLRVTALNAIGCAEQLVASRPRGQVQ
ncbi:MAG TPA: Asd/ArgC dimerization domain-containing protein [Terriglobales bacterium]|nr:Asd/ArgC dimerization domain-containing protein [Terriglobales bacterium]